MDADLPEALTISRALAAAVEAVDEDADLLPALATVLGALVAAVEELEALVRGRDWPPLAGGVDVLDEDGTG